MNDNMMNNITITKTRLAYIDFIKIFSIMSVVLTHFLPIGSMLRNFLYTSNLCTFFVVSGITSKPAQTAEDLKRIIFLKANRILIPYFLWAILSFLFSFVILKQDSIRSFAKDLLFIDGVRNSFNVTLWFLPCFFVVTVMFYVITYLIKNKKAVNFIGLVFTILSIVTVFFKVKDCFLGFNKCLLLFGFYLLGFNIKSIKISSRKVALVAITLFTVLSFTFAYMHRGRFISIHQMQYENHFLLWIITAYPANICLVMFAKYFFEKIQNKFLALISDNTMLVMALHLFFKPIYEFFFGQNHLIWGTVSAIIVSIVCICVIIILHQIKKKTRYKLDFLKLLGINI